MTTKEPQYEYQFWCDGKLLKVMDQKEYRRKKKWVRSMEKLKGIEIKMELLN